MEVQGELFGVGEKKRSPPRVMMHVFDAGDHGCLVDDPGENIVRLRCVKCDHETDWILVRNVTEGKCGKPCPVCNDS